MTTSKLENYRALLLIRRAGRRRDLFIAGGIFLVSFIATIALGLLGSLDGRSVYLITAMIVSFGFSSMMTWGRLEVIKGLIELIENLLLSEEV